MTDTPEADDAPEGQRALLELIAGEWISESHRRVRRTWHRPHLKDGPHSAAEIATMVGASEDAVFRLLRALASVGLLARSRRAISARGGLLVREKQT
jgi:hypothetical protein